MSLRRQLSFTDALRDMKRDRVPVQPGVLAAKSFVATVGKARRLSLVTPTGAFDRAAIMTLAAAAAKARQARTGEDWKVCIAAALKGAWMAAKTARYARAH